MVLIEWCVQPLRFEQERALSFPAKVRWCASQRGLSGGTRLSNKGKVLANAAALRKKGFRVLAHATALNNGGKVLASADTLRESLNE